ncbi:putative chromatin regulator PHD family [Arabidopsis thaliana]
MDSGGDDLSFQPLFFCPKTRMEFLSFNEDEDNTMQPFNSSPHLPSTRNNDRKGQYMLDCYNDKLCKLPVVPLFWCNNKQPDRREFKCKVCNSELLSVSYYVCLQCKNMFHRECVEAPLEIKHPSHPFHSLQLYNFPKCKSCICCKEYMPHIYHCTTCQLSMHPVCAMRPIPCVVNHPKSHPHPLTFFPSQASLVCHICGLIQKLDPTYICIQCVFAIHKDCIGFPHVIRISRHSHRISFTSSLPSGNLSCGVCRQQVDNNYGAYSCNKCDGYFVHSKCGIHPKVWDGKELEGVPEEDDKIDDGEPFERIADGVIHHLSHSHNLRLEIFRAYDESKYCRGCALPIYEGQFYTCMECDFILHDCCANAPRMKRHPLHPHPLTLHNMESAREKDVASCTACTRKVAGFYYSHRSEQTEVTLDLRCASIIEPFEFYGHKHPLFLPWESKKETRCQICKEDIEYTPKVNCMDCDYNICFRCASLPDKVRYKHDSHFLMIQDEKEGGDQPDWCEICEGKIEVVKEAKWGDAKKERRFYKCDDCCITLHVECLLGADIYMKSAQTKNATVFFLPITVMTV